MSRHCNASTYLDYQYTMFIAYFNLLKYPILQIKSLWAPLGAAIAEHSNMDFLESQSSSRSSEMHGICPRFSEKQDALYLYSQKS